MKKLIIIFILSLICACEITDKISNIGTPSWSAKYENLVLTEDTINLAKELSEDIPEIFANENNKLVFKKECSNNNTIDIFSAATGDSSYNFILGDFYVQIPEEKYVKFHENEEYVFSGSTYNYTSSYLIYEDLEYLIIDTAKIKITVVNSTYDVKLSNVVIEILNDVSNEIIVSSTSDTLFASFDVGTLDVSTSSLNTFSEEKTLTTKRLTQKIKFRVKADISSGTKYRSSDFLSIRLAFITPPRVTAANAKLYDYNFKEISMKYPLALSKDIELYRAVVDAQETSNLSIKIKSSDFGKDIKINVYSTSFPGLSEVITVPACFGTEITTTYSIPLKGITLGNESSKIDSFDVKMQIVSAPLTTEKGRYRASSTMNIISSYGKISYQEVVGIIKSDIELTTFSDTIEISDKYPYFGRKYQGSLTKLDSLNFFSNNYYIKYDFYVPINTISSGTSLSNLINIPIAMTSHSTISSNNTYLNDTLDLNVSSSFINNTYTSSKSDNMFKLINTLPNKVDFHAKVNLKSTGTTKIRIYCGNYEKFKSKVFYYADLGISTLKHPDLLSSDTTLYLIPKENREKKVKTIDTKISESKLENMDSIKVVLIYKNLTATPILADIIFSSDKSFIYDNHSYFTSLDNLISNNSSKIKRINTGYLKPNTGIDTVYISIDKEFLSLFDGEVFCGTFIHYKNDNQEIVHDYFYLKTYFSLYIQMDDL